MIKLWQWLYLMAKKKVDDHLRSRHGCSVICPWCRTWSWQTDGVLRWEYNETGDLATMICKHCDRESKWGTDHALPYCITDPTKTKKIEFLEKLVESGYSEGWIDGMGNKPKDECWEESQTRQCLEYGLRET